MELSYTLLTNLLMKANSTMPKPSITLITTFVIGKQKKLINMGDLETGRLPPFPNAAANLSHHRLL